MPLIPDNFPHTMKDKELEECIKGYMNKIIQSKAQENVVIQNYPLVSLGQYELQKRQNKRFTLFAAGISAISLIIAGVALYIAITNSHSSERWEKNQINVLNTIGITSTAQKEQLIEINNQLNKLENNQLTDIGNYLNTIEKNTANKAYESDVTKKGVTTQH